VPLCKKVNEINGLRSDAEKLKDPRPIVKESFIFDSAGNVTLEKEDHQELQRFICENMKVQYHNEVSEKAIG